MSEFNVISTVKATGTTAPGSITEKFPWYAIRTRSNHERVAAMAMAGKGYEPYVPCFSRYRRRGCTVIEGEYPLFPGYVFCQFDVTKRLPILMTAGVISILGFGREPAPVPDQEMEAVRAVLQSELRAEPCPYLIEGQRIRVQRGPLDGVEGILVRKKSTLRMVISITLLQRSLSVEVDSDRIASID